MWNRTIAAAVVSVCLLSVSSAIAQPGSAEQDNVAASSQQAIREAYRLSQAAKEMADFEKMIEMLEGALESDTLNEASVVYAQRLKGWAHNRRGELLAAEGKEKSATIQFQLAVELNENHWKARYNRGVSHSLEGEIEKAIDELSSAIELKRDHALSWFNRGEAFYTQGKLRESIRDYTEAIRLDPENARFYHHRGYSRYRLREYNEAVSDFDSSIELKSNDAVPYVYRGDAYAELGSYGPALQNYRRALDLDKEMGRAYLSVAWLLATCPDDKFRSAEQAITLAKKAISLDGEQVGHRYLETLAAAQANAGEFEDARETQARVIEQAPESALADCRIRLALYSENQPYRQQPTPSAGEWHTQQDR